MLFFKNKVLLMACFVFFIFFQKLCAGELTEIDRLLNTLKYDYPKDDSSEFNLLYELSYALKPDSCLLFAERLIQKASKNGNYLWTCRGYLHKGNALLLNGRLEEATKAYFKSAELAKLAKNSEGLANAYASLGSIYLTIDNHRNAIYYYQKAVDIYRVRHDSISLASTLLNIGTEYEIIKRLDSALNYLNEAQLIFRKKGHENGIAYSIGNIGFVYGDKGDVAVAEENILLATKMLYRLGDNYSVGTYLCHLAEIYTQQRVYKKAFNCANKALVISKRYGFNVQTKESYYVLTNICAKTGDYKKAYEYNLLYNAYRDSINNNESTQKIADLRTSYEVAQKQTEIDLLTKRKNIQHIIAGSLAILVLISGVFVFALYRNIRKTKALNALLEEQKEELLTQHEQLEALNKTKDRFFSIISHDLRGPIGSIGNLPELFHEYIAMNDIHELSELVVSMDISVRRVSSLLDNLLEWALSQQGTFPYHPERIYLNRVMEEVFSIFSIMAETKGIALKEAVAVEIFVFADRNSLMTILRNLLSNAIKFSNQGDTIMISAMIEGNKAILTVRDTGVGMADAKVQKLFMLNEKKSTWGTENEKGLGIGLSLVHDFVLMNSGTIDVTSKLGEGTTFTIKLPLWEDAPPAAPSPFEV